MIVSHFNMIVSRNFVKMITLFRDNYQIFYAILLRDTEILTTRSFFFPSVAAMRFRNSQTITAGCWAAAHIQTQLEDQTRHNTGGYEMHFHL